jgi:hypothetical protein
MTTAAAQPLSLAKVLCLLLFVFVGPSCGQTYNCSPAHCYGEITLNQQGNISLFSVVLDTPQLLGGDGHISDELWLSQQSSSCPGADAAAVGLCWVEVGVAAGTSFPDATVTHYFWAEAPPNGNYVLYDFGVVPSTQFGQLITLMIENLQNQGQPNTFTATIFYGLPIIIGTLFSEGTSANNTMVATNFSFGLEVYGTKNASATDAHFITPWVVSGDGSNSAFLGGGTADFWNNQAMVDNYPPVDADWEVLPTQSQSGEKFHTKCCS